MLESDLVVDDGEVDRTVPDLTYGTAQPAPKVSAPLLGLAAGRAPGTPTRIIVWPPRRKVLAAALALYNISANPYRS